MYLEVCSVHGSGGLGRACEGGRELPLAGLEALVLGVLTCRRPQGGSSALLPEHWWWGAERLGCPLGQECLGGMCLWVGNLGLAQSCSASFFFFGGKMYISDFNSDVSPLDEFSLFFWLPVAFGVVRPRIGSEPQLQHCWISG